MSLIQFSSALPENTKSSYSPFDNVDFVIFPEGRSLMLNKIRLVGKVAVRQASARLTTIANRLKDVSVDNYVGAHSYISDVQVEFMGGAGAQNSGVVEIINDYPRFVKMSKASTHNETTMVNASQSCELCSPFSEYSRAVTMGSESPSLQQTDPAIEPDTLYPEDDLDFSLKLNCCLNKASGNTNLDVSKTGAIKVSITLNRSQNALFGQDCDSDTNYELKDLKLTYCSMPNDSSSGATSMRAKYTYKTNVSSNFSNISSKVPAICDGVSISFQPESEEGSRKNNNTQLSKLPNVSEVVFSFNDSTSGLISYSIKDAEEIVDRYLESLSRGGDHNAKLNNLLSNKAFGIGLDFRDRLNLTTTKFNTQITSKVDSASPFVAYLYFHSLIAVN